jgi:hypothetical protein
MIVNRTMLAWLPCLLAVPLLAQPQIGGGTCSSASLSGTYSLTLTGRVVSSAVAFTGASQGIGTATFDGLNKVTFTLTNNTNQAFGIAQTLSGTYSLQSNCIGVLNITTGDMANFTLESYNQGKAYLITGQDGVYSFTGNGSTFPATCTAGVPPAVYSFNGAGFTLASNAITGFNYISGLIQLNLANAITTTWNVTANGSQKSNTTIGTYTVTGCTATANVTDPAGNAYVLLFTITSGNGANFLVSGSNSQMIFTGAGRVL